jgi:hypothetical protein
MILKNRLFERKAPDRSAKIFLIFCEGNKREPHYFKYFNEISSQIRLEVVHAEPHDNNSPTGLYNKASEYVIKTAENPNPKYDLNDNDEVWFVIDTDDWGTKIDELRGMCLNYSNWLIAQSNPCFEVWLYYHFYKELPVFENIDISENWKLKLDQIVKGGFDSRKHPIFVKNAIENSKMIFEERNRIVEVGCTEVFKLAEKFYPLVSEEIEIGLRKIKE